MRLAFHLFLSAVILAQPLCAGLRWTPWTTASAAASPPFSDDFNRSNQDPIAGNWESGLGSEGQVKISSNAAVNGTGSGRARVKPASVTFSGNQRAEVVWNGSNYDNGVGPTVRNQSSGAHYYVFFSYTYAQGAIGYSDGAGTNTELGSRFYGYPANGTTFGLEINGTSITAYMINSGSRTDLATRTDSTLSGGTPGFWITAGTLTSFTGANY